MSETCQQCKLNNKLNDVMTYRAFVDMISDNAIVRILVQCQLLIGGIIGASDIVEGSEWMHPLQNTTTQLFFRKEFDRYQAAELAIWKHAPREFVFRQISPIPEHADKTIRVISITGDKETGYKREKLVFSWSENRDWVASRPTIEDVDIDLAKDAFELIRKHLRSVKVAEDVAAPGLDDPFVLWECVNSEGRPQLLQGLQSSAPSDQQSQRDYAQILKAVYGD